MFAGLDSEGNLVVTCGRDDVRASAVLQSRRQVRRCPCDF